MATDDKFQEALIGWLKNSVQTNDLHRELVIDLIAIRRTLHTLGPQVIATLEIETARAKSLVSGQIQIPAVLSNLSKPPEQGQD